MPPSRRDFLAAAAALIASASNVHAQALPKPFVIYDDELKNNWQNYSWAKTQLSVPAGNGKPIKVEGEPWSALALHHDAFSTEGYTKLTFYINGGSQGGQTLLVRAMADGKVIETDFAIQPKAKTWTVVEVPLKDINAAGRMVDSFILQGKETAYPAYYVTRLQLE